MPYVDGEFSLYVLENHAIMPHLRYWHHGLNTNYLSDMDEINAAIVEFPSRIDEYGVRWVRCDFNTIKCIIEKVIDAEVQGRASTWFMWSNVRDALIALGCIHVRSQRLPRDCLREIAGWLRVDETAALVDIINRYTTLKQVKGLYVRTVCDQVCGELMRVTSISYTSDGGQTLSEYHLVHEVRGMYGHYSAYCVREGRPLRTYLYLKYPAVDSQRLEFISNLAAIEFVHKRLDKRLQN